MSIEKRDIIASILNIENNAEWDVTDFIEEKGLYNVHYGMNVDDDILNDIGNLRGVVVDVNNKKVVCRSFGYTKSVVASDLSEYQDLKVKIGYEGTVIRVFKHDGVVYTSTHKKLNPVRSRWGNSITFLEMYNNLNGPKDELFDEKPYSPYVYTFLVVHPQLLFASKINIEEQGRLVFLKRFSMDLEGIDNIETEPHGDEIVSKLYQNEYISVEQGNKHLSTGFYESNNQTNLLLQNGEFLIGEDSKGEIYRIMSPAYNWRVNIRQGDSNMYHNYVMLLNFAKISNEQEELRYNKMFPRINMNDPKVKQLIEELPKINDGLYNIHIRNIFISFMLSVPNHIYNEAKMYYQRYFNEVRELISWINDIARNGTDINISKDIKDIIFKSKGPNQYNNIQRNVIFRNKKNVYQMIREMKKIKAFPVEN